MTQTADSKTINLTLTPAAKKKVSKKKEQASETATPSETSTPDLVNTATCPETGATYSVGDWVSYSIKGAAMTGQILTLESRHRRFSLWPRSRTIKPVWPGRSSCASCNLPRLQTLTTPSRSARPRLMRP